MCTVLFPRRIRRLFKLRKTGSSKGSVHLSNDGLPTDEEGQLKGNLNVTSTTTRKRRALLVGITYCSPSNTWDPLDGPFGDVERYRELLINTYGYRPEDVCVLKDDPDPEFPEHSQPTRANIIRELENLVSGAAPGDRFTFFYSGHSGQQPAINDLQEEDGLDEMIIPSDEQPILDDELKAILVPIPVGCNLLAILDTCHSGTLLDLPHYHCNSVYVPWQSKGKRRTMTRQNINVRRQATDRDLTNSEPPRSIEAIFENQPVDSASRQNPPASRQVGRGRGNSVQSDLSSESQFRPSRRSRDRPLFGSRRCASPEPRFVCDGWCEYSDVPHPNVLSLSACSDLQSAWEGPHGSLTTVLCNYLQTNNHPTYKDLMLHINDKLHDNAMALHEYTHDQKKRAARGEGNGFDGDLDNFQEPELSSLVKLNMDDTLQL